MDASEEHDASYHDGEYTPMVLTPPTHFVRGAYVHDRIEVGTATQAEANDEFTRWLETVRAEAKAEALNESATYAVEWVGIVGDGVFVDLKTESEYADTAAWLRARANQYKEGYNA